MEHNEEKKYYEASFLLSEETQIEAVMELLEKAGTEHVQTAPGGRQISLSYPIEKKTNAYFITLNFFAKPEIIEPLTRDLRLSESILRFLIISAVEKRAPEESMLTQEKDIRNAPTQSPRSTQKDEAPRQTAGDAAVSNEELEKKLEEILNQ